MSVGRFAAGPLNTHGAVFWEPIRVVPRPSVDTLLRSAHELYSQGRYPEVLVLCSQVYQQDPARTDNLLLLGAAHFQLRHFPQSIFFNQQAIQADPSFAEAYSNLGNTLKEMGDIEGATQLYQTAIRLKPKFTDAINNLASALMESGRPAEAMEAYRLALRLNPRLADARNNLGNLLKGAGQLEEARGEYIEALRLRPDFSVAWSNLAGVYRDSGDLETAVAYYREALRLDPSFADALSNLGNALKDRRCFADAIACYKEAVKCRPDFAAAWNNLALAHYEQGQHELAIGAYKQALLHDRNLPDVYNNLGNAYKEAGALAEAIECYQLALRLKPDHAHALNNLGNALKEAGYVAEALKCYVAATTLLPTFAAAHSNLGSLYKELNRLDEAIAHLQTAIACDPGFADAFCNLGNALKDRGHMDEAVAAYARAIELNPAFAIAHSNLASVYKDTGRVNEAIYFYRRALALRPRFADALANLAHSLQFVCDWEGEAAVFPELVSVLQEQLAAPGVVPSVQPFHTLCYACHPETMLHIAQRYAWKAAAVVKHATLPPPPPPPPLAPGARARLRLGYVSSDFGNHPLSHLMQSVFGLHDRARFEVFCFALSPSDGSPWRQRISREADHFVDVSRLSAEDTALAIRGAGVDVLVNLNGYTKGARNEVFALQPAPVQVAYMGFCGTMGAPYIQYMVADATVVPPAMRPFYSEALVYMPHSYFVNDHRQSSRDVLDPACAPTRAAYGIPEDKFVFANFNQLYKIDPKIFDVWCRVLQRVPDSVLWLLRFPAAGVPFIQKEAERRGLSAARIIFTDVAPKDEHIRRGVLADLFLDTPLCNAHTTACDILWSGTPLLTLPGEKMAARVAASLLRAAELPELVVDSLDAYEETAVELAADPARARLQRLRRHLADRREQLPAFDTARWVRNLDSALEQVWARHCAGEAPQDLVVRE